MAELVDLKALIAASFGDAAAGEWSKFTLGDNDKQRLGEAGRRVLEVFPGKLSHACALMSAMYAVGLEALKAPPGYVVAGSLYVGDTRIYGEDGDIDGKSRFSQSNPSWDGHAWIVHGDFLADASIFRTAYSGRSHARLKEHIVSEFGEGRGLFAIKLSALTTTGLRYVPQYVLTQDQVDALARGAMKLIGEQ